MYTIGLHGAGNVGLGMDEQTGSVGTGYGAQFGGQGQQLAGIELLLAQQDGIDTAGKTRLNGGQQCLARALIAGRDEDQAWQVWLQKRLRTQTGGLSGL